MPLHGQCVNGATTPPTILQKKPGAVAESASTNEAGRRIGGELTAIMIPHFSILPAEDRIVLFVIGMI